MLAFVSTILTLLAWESSSLNLKGAAAGPYGTVTSSVAATACSGAPTITFEKNEAYLFNQTALGHVGDLRPGFRFNYAPFAAQDDDAKMAVALPFDNYYYYSGGSVYIFDDKDADAFKCVDGSKEELKQYKAIATSVAVDNDVLAVGTWGDDVLIYNAAGTQTGVAQGLEGLVFYDGTGGALREGGWSGWSWSQRTLAVDGTNDLIVVGASNYSGGSGLAYVFNSNGEELDRLSIPDSCVTNSDRFGSAVAVDNGIIVVGSPGGEGSALIFEWDGDSARFLNFVKAQSGSENFGFAVDVDTDHDTIVVGAPMKNVAYIFDTAGGHQSVLFSGDEPDDSDNSCFGYSVAAARGVIAVGAPLENENRGRVYLFDKAAAAGTKCYQATLELEKEPEEMTHWVRFGWSVQIGGTPLAGFVAVGNMYGVEIQPFTKTR